MGKTMELLEKYVLGLHQGNKSNTERRGKTNFSTLLQILVKFPLST
jgi:hypothetical protein